MPIRYITVAWDGKIYEVGNLFDQFAQPTTDPELATSCVVRFDDHHWHATRTDGIPIYTVH